MELGHLTSPSELRRFRYEACPKKLCSTWNGPLTPSWIIKTLVLVGIGWPNFLVSFSLPHRLPCRINESMGEPLYKVFWPNL